MAELSKDDHAKLVELLADFAELATENQRRDVLIDAGLRDLLPRLDLSGAPGLAVNRLVDDLDAASLKLLIAWAKKQSGVEQQQLLEGIAGRIDPPKPPTPPGTPEQPESPDKPKGSVVKLELDLGGTITNFNQEAFQRELSRLLGAQVKGVKITSIQPGSVKITLEGDPEALRALVEKLEARDAQTKQFIRATDLIKAQFTADDGKQYAIKLDGMSWLAIAAIVVAAVVVGGIVVWKVWPSDGGPSAPDASTRDARVRDAAVPDAHVPDGHPRDATRPRDTNDEPPIDAPAGDIAVVINSDPSQVDVTLDGLKLGTTPINTKIHRGTNTHAKLRGTKAGFTPADADVDATRDIQHLFVLRPARGTATPIKQSKLTVLFQLEGDEALALEQAKSFMARKCRLQRLVRVAGQFTELDRPARAKIAFRCGDAFDENDLVGLWHETNLQGRPGDVTFQAGGKYTQTLHSVDPVSCPGTYILKLVDANHAVVTLGSPGCEVTRHALAITWGDFDDRWHAGTLVKQ